MISPLHTWLADDRAVARFRERGLGRAAIVLTPQDRTWRRIVPDFDELIRLIGAGLPFHVVAERRYDRSGDARRLGAALAGGATVYVPQVHQVLPRLARLMVALRTGIVGGARDESSYLFVVQGRGRAGMGLHHDGPVHGFWLQIDGRRTVTIGPPVPRRTPLDLDDGLAGRGGGWRTVDLTPGTLFHLPPYTPHAVVCRRRSVAVSMTWAAGRAGRTGAVDWDVVSGRAAPPPTTSPAHLWTQVPVAVSRPPGNGTFRLRTPDGSVRLPASAYALARRLALMPWLSPEEADRAAAGVAALLRCGILAPEDLPLAIEPARPRALDGWRFR